MPNRFPSAPLHMLASRITDGSHFSPTPQEHGYLIANVKDMRSGFIDLSSCTRISAEAYRELKATGCTIRNGNVLLSKDGTVGRVVVYQQDDEIGALSSICIIVPTEEVNSAYLGHALQSEICVRQFENFMSGSALRRLVLRDIRTIEIPVPSVEQQFVIAQILDTLDTAIRETEALIDKLKAVKQGLLHDLLTRGIDANGHLRPPQSEAPQLYKESPLGWIPREWEVVKLGAVLSELGQGWSPDCPSEPAGVGEWGVLKTTSVVWEGYNEEENKQLPVPFKPRPDLEVKSDDILITRAGPKSRVGVVVHVPSTRPQLMISDKIYRLRLLSSEVPAYFALALSAGYMQSAISRTVSGMAESQTNISQGVIKGLAILRPIREEQHAIVAHAQAFDERLRAEALILSKLQAQKNGLMDDLLTGRVRVTPMLESVQRTAEPTEA